MNTRDFFKNTCSLCRNRKKVNGGMICDHPDCVSADKTIREAFALLDHILDPKTRSKARAQILSVAHVKLEPPMEWTD
jgi:hypothetical protein